MNKVSIEITKKGWKTTVQLGEKQFSEEWELGERRSASCSESIDEDDLPEELYNAVDSMVFRLEDIARELK